MEKPIINIEVISDVVCPWCYIGKRRLEKAMELASDHFDFYVEYFPFELNPHLPEEGVDQVSYLRKKFGSEERYQELTEHVRMIAAREGLVYNMHLQQTIPNTRNVHRIIMIAREAGKQLEVVEAFFKAYFTDGANLTDLQTQLAIAAEAGLDTEGLDDLLQSNTGNLEIEMAEKELQDLGITSVPLFIVENRFAISGAQSVEAFTKAFYDAMGVHYMG